ncbi:hypothetical protein NPIL_136371 [Nephila pilipes]|uniref:Uncharacterized protein n=1 Tax=Nephila pilipes TaxID=299642 RepID=A0A8X6QXM2_NEPPI|nr:hypothetical protein NPIL_136371 [Nephila pilipes]
MEEEAPHLTCGLAADPIPQRYALPNALAKVISSIRKIGSEIPLTIFDMVWLPGSKRYRRFFDEIGRKQQVVSDKKKYKYHVFSKCSFEKLTGCVFVIINRYLQGVMIEHIKNTVEEDSIDCSTEDMVPNINSNITPVPTEQIGCESRLVMPFRVPEKNQMAKKITILSVFSFNPCLFPASTPLLNAPDDQFIHRFFDPP